MALFPTSPTNGQQTTVNNITYTYDSTQTAWVRSASGSNASFSSLTVTGNTFLATTSGNVGIGTSSPVYKLDVNKGSAGTIARFTDGVAQTLVIKTLDTSGVVIQNDNSGYIAFNNSSERMRITSDGNIGIGNTAPTDALSVTGAIRSSTFYIHSVATDIAAAGTVQANATALTKDFNVVSTVTAGQGVTLPTAVAGYRITVLNTSANALNVYPLGNGIINSQAANVAYSQPAGARLDFICTTSTTAPGGQWYTLNATYG